MVENLLQYINISVVIFVVNMILSAAVIFLERKNPTTTVLWVMVIMFLPIVGFIIYIIFGVDLSKTKMFKNKTTEDEFTNAYALDRIEEIIEGQYDYNDKQAYEYDSMIRLLSVGSFSKYTEFNKVEVFSDGILLADDIINEINNARNSIYIEYYIISSGVYFDRVKEALIKKAKEGVEIKLLVDGMGGRKLKRSDINEMKDAGIEYVVFFPPTLGPLNVRVNFRNHRKIIVIDSEVGYMGGFNIADEYINLDEKFGYWRDTHLKIHGEAINDLTNRFFIDYKFASGNQYGRYLSHVINKDYNVAMNIVSSGPDHKLEQIRDGFDKMISLAKKRIYIQTPYFIPDEGLLKSLRMAAYSGTDVRIMVPRKPDHPFVKSASRSYLSELLEFGAKVYYYQNDRFLHAKTILIDDFVSSVGTANFDIRSFKLNFEINAFIYDSRINNILAKQFLDDIVHCDEYTYDEYLERSLYHKVTESLSRLLSPVL